MHLQLKRIDESNFITCFGLQLGDGQDAFVSHPIRSLAQAYVYYDQCTPFGILDGDVMVGYVMVIYDYDEQTYNIWHMMIDRAYQGRGYGKAAIRLALDYIAQKPFGDSETVLITVNPQNTVAYTMYKGLGFRETGRSDEDEVELSLSLAQSNA